MAWSEDQIAEACMSLVGVMPSRGVTGLFVIVRNMNGGDRYVVTWWGEKGTSGLSIQKLEVFARMPKARWLHVRSALGNGLAYAATKDETAAQFMARALEQHGLFVKPPDDGPTESPSVA